MRSSPHPQIDATGASIVRQLGGFWRDGKGMCLCPAHDDTHPSLSVRVGRRALLFKCFAGCETREILRAIHAVQLRLPNVRSGDGSLSKTSGASTALLAQKIWDQAVALTNGPAARYLSARGLAARPDAVRYNPRTPVRAAGKLLERPAMIASVRQGHAFVAIQRIFLDTEQAALVRDLPNAKLTLGRPLGGAVRLSPAGRVLGLAEGVETAMAASTLLGIPVWAVLGAERLHQILIPPQVRRLVLLADNDLAGRRAVRRALGHYIRDNLIIEVCWPWHGLNDWGDVLLASAHGEGRVGWGEVRRAS